MEVKQVIVIRKDLNMRKGKIAAQASHSSMQFIIKNGKFNKNNFETKFTDTQLIWFASGTAKIVVYVDSENELKELMKKAQEQKVSVYSIIDSGKTEFNGVPTLTCAAFGPDTSSKIDKITGHCKLL